MMMMLSCAGAQIRAGSKQVQVVHAQALKKFYFSTSAKVRTFLYTYNGNGLGLINNLSP